MPTKRKYYKILKKLNANHFLPKTNAPIDISRYKPIHKAIPLDTTNAMLPIEAPYTNESKSTRRQIAIKTNLILFDFQLIFVNFNANIGISQTRSQLNITTNANRNKELNRGDVKKSPQLLINAPQNIALAGVGMPIKPVCWRSSILNLASRYAEKAAIKKAVNGR